MVKMSNQGFRGIPGVPDGWELVAVRPGCCGDWHINADGKPVRVSRDTVNLLCIIRKIEVPKRYRQFANAEEFKPYRDRWTMHPQEPNKRFKPGDYNDLGVWSHDHRFYSYAELLESGLLFEDGSPFGVEVTSE
jgi:hypothetical protein